jgi:trimethylamine--corrinoid protein Co-methyltransferase
MAEPHITMLSGSDLEFIHERTLEVLEKVGVRFQSARARTVLAAAGCVVDAADERVRFPRDLVEWALGKLQRDVLLAGRDPRHDALLDGSRTFATIAGICPHVVDVDTGLYRLPREQDLADITRVADALDACGIVWYSVSPTEGVAAKMVDVVATARMLANTGKHIQAQVQRPAEVPFVLEMLEACAPASAAPAGTAQRAGAKGASAEASSSRRRPFFSVIYCPIAPLQHEAPALEAAMALAEERVPIDIFSLGLAGATAPVTLAGTMIQTNCDVLSAVVLFQQVAEGCPLIYSANAGIMDMRTSRFAAASPEAALMNVAQTELVHSYGMPALSVGHVSDSSTLDFRGGLEDMGMSMATRLARPDIMTGLGTVEAGQAVSLLKLVLDADLSGYLDRVLTGIAVDEDHAATVSIADVGPGGHYLARKETRRGVRSGEHWVPRLLNRDPYSDRERGAPGALERARDEVDRILAEHDPLPLPPGGAGKLADILARAEVELPEA